jgi:hypothetical protein
MSISQTVLVYAVRVGNKLPKPIKIFVITFTLNHSLGEFIEKLVVFLEFLVSMLIATFSLLVQ